MTSCNVFHLSEIPTDPTGDGAEAATMSGGEDTGVDAQGSSESDGSSEGDSLMDASDEHRHEDSGALPIDLSDYCTGDVPRRTASDEAFSVNGTSTLQDNVSDLSNCGLTRELRGSDGFFAVQMSAGEKWHFHVHGTAEEDIALYLLPTCDARSCVKAIDRCPKGQDEHVTVVVASAGLYYFGIDGIEGQATYPITVLAIKPVCGDGTKVHSEGCDDGNLNDGDGCDSRCRYEIPSTGADAFDEKEPNGDFHTANVVRMPIGLGSFTVKGQIGGPCDTDSLSVRAPAGATLRAIMRNESSMPCAHATPAVTMSITDVQGVVLETGAPSEQSGVCPSIQWGPVEAGEYYVQFATDDSTMPFKYQVEVEVSN